MMELRSKARRLKSREPKLGLVMVDYLQLMTAGSNPENRVQEISQITRSLKALARDLEVPIVALSQLSRAVEQRHDKRPMLSDLRDGRLEQDADLVAFVYREEYYKPEEPELKGLAEMIIAKHRNGPTDAVKLSFLKRYAKFTDLRRRAARSRQASASAAASISSSERSTSLAASPSGTKESLLAARASGPSKPASTSAAMIPSETPPVRRVSSTTSTRRVADRLPRDVLDRERREPAEVDDAGSMPRCGQAAGDAQRQQRPLPQVRIVRS